MIFLDSNVPMYLVGAAHPLKTESQVLLERVIASNQRIVTDAEVLQEILHRYAAIGRREAIRPAIELTLQIADHVYPMERQDVLRAAEIVQHPASLRARDALHIAVMERHGLKTILSFDSDFDRWPGIQRLYQP